MSKNAVVNTLILAATMVMVSVILVAGRDTGAEVPPALAVGQPAPETFIANRSTEPIEDEVETQAARDDARANVPTVYSDDSDATFCSFWAGKGSPRTKAPIPKLIIEKKL